AVGLQTALHPMADLATEPRWARNFGTFGSNAQLSGEMTNAYMLGFQGATLTGQSVMTMVKHFPGGGPQEFGLDAHLPSGKRQVYPGNNFDYHVEPFKKAIANGLRVIMPYYGVPVGQTNDDVAMGYNKMILTDLLRDELGFTGVVCTDWGIVSSRAWGVEGLTIRERYKKSIDAGVDQYGGESDPEHIIDMVNSGELTVERIDESVRRILINKFDLGLFEQAMVDEGLVDSLVRKPEYISAGLDAQRKSIVLLKNEASKGRTLPAAEGKRIFIDGLDVDQAKSFGNVVSSPDQADIIILYLPTVFNGNQAPGSNELIDKFLSGILPDGDLTYGSDILKKAKTYADYATLITVVDLNRPAILTELNKFSDGLIGIFGVYDSILYEVIFGQFSPQGKLPFEIPSSMESVENQKEDLPDDSESPIFEFGHGLTY
ncbi:MAG: glycoside hydrolase family 3 N-terminal domain-containing protein, partial [Porticoccaceae bacterium]|nr:glycoside hydrolase family 3 N-terminal domain-containing protein [Porticoccaceae bacterium]